MGTGHFDWGPLTVPTAAMADAKVVDWAADFLAREHEQPFFLAVGIFRPHLPWYVPKKYFEMFPLETIQLPEVKEGDLADIPPAGVRIARPQGDHAKVVAHQQWKHAVQGYLASIAFADEMLGRVLDAWESSPEAENTIVVLWSDHGWHLGEKQHWRKFALWQRAVRVPMIVVAPGVTKPGTHYDRPVSLLDIYPTVAELAGLPEQAAVEGESLVPCLKDPQHARARPAVCTFGRNNHAVIADTQHYIRYTDGSEELYDRRQDPHQWTNLAQRPENKPIIASLKKWLPDINRAGPKSVR